MTVHVALLRAVNVGGTGKLPMNELRTLAEDIGFLDATTFIQSGNLVFRNESEASAVAARLDAALATKLGKPPGVFVRSRAELKAILADNPFSDMEPSRVLVSFFAEPLPDDVMHGLLAPDGEEAVALGREIYVHYPMGIGKTRLKLPILRAGTARNINTVSALLRLAAELEERE